jgi:hypothetical protein
LQAGQKLSHQEILQAAAENGRLTLAALREYSYYDELTIETVSQADTLTGKYYRFAEISFDRDGNRRERVIETTSTLPKDVYIGTTTAKNLVRIYQFMITPDTLSRYDFNFVGRERLDELSTYVFDVEPRVKMSEPEKNDERFLKGRVWIDDQDLCLVKVAGQPLPEEKALRVPRFETYFQNEGKYWFPAYSSADDRIRLDKYPARVIVKLRFTGYKKVNLRG